MAFRGARREPAEQSGRPHRRLSVVALAAVLVALSVVVVTGRATGSGPTRCETFAADSAARAGAVSGAGEDLLVIGDSWTAGLGLDEPTRSWTVRLPGRVHTAGFSGSGFSAGASGCGPQVSFAARARAASAVTRLKAWISSSRASMAAERPVAGLPPGPAAPHPGRSRRVR